MQAKQKVRMTLDITMTLLSVTLMGGTMLFGDDRIHQILGMVLFVLWTIHIILNRRWYAGIFRGKYKGQRVFQTIVNVGLLICALLLMLSGLSMAWFMPSTFGISVSRTIHLVSSHWYYIFMSFHLGLHLEQIFSKLQGKKNINRQYSIILQVLICVYGLYAFIIRGVWKYMLCLQPFFFIDLGNGGFWGYIKYVLDYILILFLFAIITRWIKSPNMHFKADKSCLSLR